MGKPVFSGPGGNGKKGERERRRGRTVICGSGFLLSRLLSRDDERHQLRSSGDLLPFGLL